MVANLPQRDRCISYLGVMWLQSLTSLRLLPRASKLILAFRSLRDILEGEEITFDYNSTEYDLSRPFRCLCGAERCLGYIRGYRYLTANDRESRLSILADHLRFMDKGIS